MSECEFCKEERPLILYGEYQICYNCMMRVIAAAPELLRALEDTLEDYERIAGFTGLKPEDFENIRRARAAIAKAKGKGK